MGREMTSVNSTVHPSRQYACVSNWHLETLFFAGKIFPQNRRILGPFVLGPSQNDECRNFPNDARSPPRSALRQLRSAVSANRRRPNKWWNGRTRANPKSHPAEISRLQSFCRWKIITPDWLTLSVVGCWDVFLYINPFHTGFFSIKPDEPQMKGQCPKWKNSERNRSLVRSKGTWTDILAAHVSVV